VHAVSEIRILRILLGGGTMSRLRDVAREADDQLTMERRAAEADWPAGRYVPERTF
jgi:hypothetical protein